MSMFSISRGLLLTRSNDDATFRALLIDSTSLAGIVEGSVVTLLVTESFFFDFLAPAVETLLAIGLPEITVVVTVVAGAFVVVGCDWPALAPTGLTLPPVMEEVVFGSFSKLLLFAVTVGAAAILTAGLTVFSSAG